MDHAGAFGHPGDPYRAPPESQFAVRDFHHRVGSQDRARDVIETSRGQALNQFRQSVGDEARFQLDADHACGGWENLCGGDAQVFTHCVAASQCHAVACSGSAIRVARVDQDGTHQTTRLFQMEASDPHWRRLHTVFGEDGRAGSRRV